MPAKRVPKRSPAQATKLAKSADTAVQLLREIKQGRVDPHTLTPNQRRACLLLMANGTQTSAELSELFGVQPTTIRKDLREVRAELGREVREWSPDEVVGDLALAAERYSAHALRQEDPGLAWKIKLDFAEHLRKLGLLGGKDSSGVRVTVEMLGEGYERMRGMLAQTLDPRLTGEVVDVEGEVRPLEDPKPTSLDRRGNGVDHDPGVEIVTE